MRAILEGFPFLSLREKFLPCVRLEASGCVQSLSMIAKIRAPSGEGNPGYIDERGEGL